MKMETYRIDPNQLMNEDADVGSTMHIVGLLNNSAEYTYGAKVIRYEEPNRWETELRFAHLVYANIKPEEIKEVHLKYNACRDLDKGSLRIFNSMKEMKDFILDNPAKFV